MRCESKREPARTTDQMSLQLKINGEDCVSISDPLTPLVDVLRDEFFLTGAKVVCREGFCGACIVLVDGEPVVSCLMPVGMAADRDVRTIESLAPEGDLSALQRALEQHDVVQCGMCFPGMLMSLTSYFERTTHPNREDMKAALVGNICRCTGYERILDAALSLLQPVETQ
jgi:aerobic carbon-monoxide dehydrogenase small subunit